MCWNWLVVNVGVVCVCVPRVVLFLPRGHQIAFSELLSLSIEKAFGLGVVSQNGCSSHKWLVDLSVLLCFFTVWLVQLLTSWLV